MIREPADIAFDRAVSVQLRFGHERVVTSVAQAARLLMDEWPVRANFNRCYAMQACLRALRGERSMGYARRSFIAAAKDVGIFVGEIAEAA